MPVEESVCVFLYLHYMYIHVRAWICTYMYEDACTYMYKHVAVGECARLSVCAIRERVCVYIRVLGMVGVSPPSLPTSCYVV